MAEEKHTPSLNHLPSQIVPRFEIAGEMPLPNLLRS